MIFSPFAFQNSVVSAPAPFVPSIITSGLHLYVATYDNTSYPGTGTTYYDLSPNGYNGDLLNGISYNGTDPKNFQTDGVNDWCYFGNSSSGSTSSDYTWGMWINLPSPIVNDRAQFQRGVDISGQAGGWSLMLVNNNSVKWQSQIVTTIPSTAQVTCAGTSTISANTWYMVCGVWDAGTSLKLFVNGSLENTVSTTRTILRNASSGVQGFNFGRASGTIYSGAKSSMNFVYTRALSDSEVLDNFNTTKQYYGY